ncbi:MAG: hypothetical protein ACP5OA_07170 [Candidatus Woesearchaeota archaeon]
MGYTYDELIPAAILNMSDGLTLEEFADKLFWIGTKVPMGLRLSEGVYGAAHILHIHFSNEYKKFLEADRKKIDSQGIELQPILFHPTFWYKDPKAEKIRYYRNTRYDVIEHLENIVMPEKVVEEYIYNIPEEGEIYTPWYGGIQRLIRLLRTEERPQKENKFDDNIPQIKALMIVEPIHSKTQRKQYRNIDALTKDYPMFSPDFMFNLNQGEGKISTGAYDSKFYWKKKDDKYYLDKEKTFDNICAAMRFDLKSGIFGIELGYTDLILTQEALKHKTYWLLDWRGKNKLPAFIDKYEDSRAKYGLAIWDSHTSLFAKSAGLTHAELLRLRMLGSVPGNLEDVIRYEE